MSAKYVPGKKNVTPQLADVAEELLSDQPGATDADATALAVALQEAFEDAMLDLDIENRSVSDAAEKRDVPTDD